MVSLGSYQISVHDTCLGAQIDSWHLAVLSNQGSGSTLLLRIFAITSGSLLRCRNHLIPVYIEPTNASEDAVMNDHWTKSVKSPVAKATTKDKKSDMLANISAKSLPA